MRRHLSVVLILLLHTDGPYAQGITGELKSKSEIQLSASIGGQVWMADDLKTRIFRNGDSIYHAESEEDWSRASFSKTPAWCYYENDSIKGEEIGVLYNWYAVVDPRGLAPDGWHIPSDGEFKKTIEFLGGGEKSLKKLKSADAWRSGNGNNNSGFNAKPGGFRSYEGVFANYGYDGVWWAVTERNIDDGYCLSINSFVSVEGSDKGAGHQVRCLLGRPDSLLGNAITYRTALNDPVPAYLFEDSGFMEVKIGDQVWMGRNLNVTTFSNGDTILEAKTNLDWIKAARNKEPAWCYFLNDPATGMIQGKLYNWYAVNDKRGLAPQQWRLPSDSDWARLVENLGENAAAKMKSTFGWKENRQGTNESGFCGIPVGVRTAGGYFKKGGFTCQWWSVPEYHSYKGSWYLQSGWIYIERWLSALPESGGFPVRCLRN